MWSGRHGSGGLVDEEAAAFPGHFLASSQKRIMFYSADVSFLLRANFPNFIFFIIVRGGQRLRGDFRAKFAREGVCRRGACQPWRQGLLDGSVDQQSASALEHRARSARSAS